MRLEVQQPILTPENMEKLRHVELFSGGAFRSIELDICYPAAWGGNGMEAALASLAAHAEDAIHQGYNIIILSDRSVAADMLPIPALLATAAVHEHLVKKGLRTSTGLVVETRLGARSAPFRAARGLRRRGDPSVSRARDARRPVARELPEIDPKECAEALHQGDLQGPLQGDVEDGHLDLPVVLRRADLRGGRPAEGVRRQVFHRHGEHDRGHRPVRSRRRGAAPARSSRSATIRCWRAALDAGGDYMYRVRGEEHMWTPDTIAKLQHAARANSSSTYREYAALINEQGRKLKTLRGLFEFKTDRARRCRSTRSSPRRKSSSASPPAR